MINDSHILLDTCILSNLSSKEKNLAKETQNLIDQLVENNNTLYISEFSKYELLRGLNENKWEKFNDLFGPFHIIQNNDQRLKRATLLYSEYRKILALKNTIHSISDVDVFIGSLIFTKQKPYLLTGDYFDFPRPFFTEEKIWDINFKKKKGTQSHIYYYLFSANLDTMQA